MSYSSLASKFLFCFAHIARWTSDMRRPVHFHREAQRNAITYYLFQEVVLVSCSDGDSTVNISSTMQPDKVSFFSLFDSDLFKLFPSTQNTLFLGGRKQRVALIFLLCVLLTGSTNTFWQWKQQRAKMHNDVKVLCVAQSHSFQQAVM